MAITLPNLPYEKNALEPHISAETLEYHYGKHHQTYVTKLNALIVGTPHEHQSLEEIILSSQGGIFNNAAQVWNHSFYWNCLSPNVTSPSDQLLEKINSHFGTMEEFKNQFTAAACAQFGSGWAWLVRTPEGDLSIMTTSNAELPMTSDHTALLTCDVWEHAYYLKHKSQRANYIKDFFKVLDWNKAEENYQRIINKD